MLLFVYTTTRKRFVIFSCRYFKLSLNTTALSQSNCRNFSFSSTTLVIVNFGHVYPDSIDLNFGLSSEFFNKIPARILLDVLFCVFSFSKASFCALYPDIFIHGILKFRRRLDTETYRRLPWQFWNFTCEITNQRWNFAPKLRSNSSPVILAQKYPIPATPEDLKKHLALPP